MQPFKVITRQLRATYPKNRLPLYATSYFSTSAGKMTRVSEAIKQDHRELEDYYNKIVNATDDDTKTAYQNQFTWELARHSIGEELVVYPAFEKNLANGKSMADKDRREHQTVR
jgi:hemerythrin superfamily protein